VRKQAPVVRDLAIVPIKSNQDGLQVIVKEVVEEVDNARMSVPRLDVVFPVPSVAPIRMSKDEQI
jgi:hypothetical protein